jgi:uncharacterized membrane protein YphA (DoxX/SURF4 family)
MTNDQRLNSAYWALRLTFGLVPLLAGIDKFFNLLTDWQKYLSPEIESLLPVSGQAFLYAAGVVEVVVGLGILTRWTRLGSYVAMAWLTLIAANLAVLGMLDIAVRDLVMAAGAYTLARLSEARGEAPAAASEVARTRAARSAS